MIRSTKILKSARGQSCTARFPDICTGSAETTVWCHLNGAAFGKGMGIKAHDVLGFYGCSACHAYYDTGHGTNPVLSNDALLECILGAVCESYVRLIQSGLVVVHQDAPKPATVKPRKSRDQRAKIPTAPKHQSPYRRKLDGTVVLRATGEPV